MRASLFLLLGLCLLAACAGQPTTTPDLVATQIAVEIAAHATMTAMAATEAPMPEPSDTPVPRDTRVPGPTQTPPPSIEAEEYAVYSALIEQNPVNYDLGSPIVVREETMAMGDGMVEGTLAESPLLSAFLVDSYRSRNAVPYTLSPLLDLDQDYTLLPQEEVADILRHGGAKWDEFRASYPGTRGMVSFSRVGFSEEGDQALALMGVVCDDLCGAGGLYLLAKVDGRWTVQEGLLVWMS